MDPLIEQGAFGHVLVTSAASVCQGGYDDGLWSVRNWGKLMRQAQSNWDFIEWAIVLYSRRFKFVNRKYNVEYTV